MLIERRLQRVWLTVFTLALTFLAAPNRGQDLPQKTDFLHFSNPYAVAADTYAAPIYPDHSADFPPKWRVLQRGTIQIPAGGRFELTALPGDTFVRDASGVDLTEEATESWPQTQTQGSYHHGLVMRSVRRILEDQKELYLTPFKPANFKWDAVELGGTGALLATDRRIETHIGTAHFTLYQATSDVAIAGLGATLSGVWAWGIKGDHPHAKETGALELETLIDTFLIYTPMQLLAARQRPGEGNGYGDFWKHHSINTSFPGGHAMFTFAMSTVVSHEYPQKWVQALAYGVASAVTVTRFMARDHWSSDMFVGSALGIGIGAHVFHAHCNPELSDSCKHHTRWIF
jgi:membrane-associated phospholipid phosphatase